MTVGEAAVNAVIVAEVRGYHKFFFVDLKSKENNSFQYAETRREIEKLIDQKLDEYLSYKSYCVDC